MADNSTTPTNGLPVASDDIGGFQYQRVKLVFGADGTNAGDVAVANGLPVAEQSNVTEDAAAAADPIGQPLIAVRRDTLTNSEVSADGDYIAIKASKRGQVHTMAGKPTLSTGTDRSGTITAGGTAQQLAASNADRTSLTVQNTSSGELRLREDGGTASSTAGYSLMPGDMAQVQTTSAVSVWGATTAQSWAATELSA